MGDAAHAMTPWQGSGAGQAIEDAMILASLLANIKTAEEINDAFRAYDGIRRPRSQQVVESSTITGLMMSGKGPDTGLDLSRLKDGMWSRWDFIHNLDMKAHKEEAVRLLKQVQEQDKD